MNDVGVVAIGRNEGERLRACLKSVVDRGMQVVYVDSGSTDRSVEVARSLGANVVELDLSIPFSAARARNEGFARLMQLCPNLGFVQFVDGDCEVVDDWIAEALAAIAQSPKNAVVCGRRRERHPETSIYNRMADLEWNTPIGVAKSCGGDALFRVTAFRQVGGFDASVVAGEEPELCQRLRDAGWTIRRIDAEMTLHDSAMLHYSQWRKRQIRSGYGANDVATRFRSKTDPLFVKQLHSAYLWTMGWLSAVMLMPCIVIFAVWDSPVATRKIVTAGTFFFVLALWPLQALRIGIGRWRQGNPFGISVVYGFMTMIGKWPFVRGTQEYEADRKKGKITRMIEFKTGSAKPHA